jgi:hypothetical protein
MKRIFRKYNQTPEELVSSMKENEIAIENNPKDNTFLVMTVNGVEEFEYFEDIPESIQNILIETDGNVEDLDEPTKLDSYNNYHDLEDDVEVSPVKVEPVLDDTSIEEIEVGDEVSVMYSENKVMKFDQFFKK